MAITFYGAASNPADNGFQAEPATLAVTPPASMVAGDLVLFFGKGRSSSGTCSIVQAGGQTWNQIEVAGTNNVDFTLFWCEFNGTWSANPSMSVSHAGSVDGGVVMLVFNQSTGGSTWSVDQAIQSAGFAAPSSPFTVTRTGQTATANDALTLAIWLASDNITWGNLAGTGWATAGGAQYRNSAGSGTSMSFAYFVHTAPGASGNASKDQGGGNHPDPGLTAIITFASTGGGGGGGPAWKVRASGTFAPAAMKHRASGVFSEVATTLISS